MAREYDVVVFGASGFTGIYVMRELLSLHSGRLRIAAAGRDSAKIRSILPSGHERIPVLNAECGDPATLHRMAASTRVLINCVGPYRFYGDAVISACVTAGTHYVDLCGEPLAMERAQLRYDDAARAGGVLIIPSCGFDSIPADLGALQCAQRLHSRGLLPHRISSYVAAHAGPAGMAAHYTTYECAVHGFGSTAELAAVRRALRDKANRGQKQSGGRSALPTWSSEYKAWVMPFPGADASVVRRSQACTELAHTPRFDYHAYFLVKSTLNMLLVVLAGIVLSVLAQFQFGRRVMLAFPGFFTLGMFTKAGPTPEQVAQTSFEMIFDGVGAPADRPHDIQTIRTRVRGPEPGYVATASMIVAAAATVLEDAASMPRGGVLTPAAAFHGTRLTQRLHTRGVIFEELP